MAITKSYLAQLWNFFSNFFFCSVGPTPWRSLASISETKRMHGPERDVERQKAALVEPVGEGADVKVEVAV